MVEPKRPHVEHLHLPASGDQADAINVDGEASEEAIHDGRAWGPTMESTGTYDMPVDDNHTRAWGPTAQAMGGYASTNANNARAWGSAPATYGQGIPPGGRQWEAPMGDGGVDTPLDGPRAWGPTSAENGGRTTDSMEYDREWGEWAQSVDNTLVLVVNAIKETKDMAMAQQIPTWDTVHADHFLEDVKNVVQDYKNGVQEEYVRYMQGAEKIQAHVDLYIAESGKKLEEKFQRTLDEMQASFLNLMMNKIEELGVDRQWLENLKIRQNELSEMLRAREESIPTHVAKKIDANFAHAEQKFGEFSQKMQKCFEDVDGVKDAMRATFEKCVLIEHLPPVLNDPNLGARIGQVIGGHVQLSHKVQQLQVGVERILSKILSGFRVLETKIHTVHGSAPNSVSTDRHQTDKHDLEEKIRRLERENDGLKNDFKLTTTTLRHDIDGLRRQYEELRWRSDPFPQPYATLYGQENPRAPPPLSYFLWVRETKSGFSGP